MANDAKKILRWSLYALFFAIIIGYGFFRSYDLIFGVQIRDVNIVDGATISEPTMPVRGNAKNAINLTLNGRNISINQEGDFEETIALLPGYNIITIRAEDKFGYVDEKDYQLIYKKND
ncbi:MAG: hypothetical protein WD991_00420 [Candidatus Paceibacterota bacterium]